jgi:hypothetical protein
MDTYGFFYDDPFNSSYPLQHLIKYNDNGNGGKQFKIDVYLVFARIYVLVVTTFEARLTGKFLITVHSPASVDLNSRPPSTSELI